MLQGRLSAWYPKARPLRPPNCRETGTPKLGPYGPPTVGRQAQEVEFSGWLACGRAHLPSRHYRLAEFVCSVAVGGIGVENDREGVKLTAQAHYEK